MGGALAAHKSRLPKRTSADLSADLSALLFYLARSVVRIFLFTFCTSNNCVYLVRGLLLPCAAAVLALLAFLSECLHQALSRESDSSQERPVSFTPARLSPRSLLSLIHI